MTTAEQHNSTVSGIISACGQNIPPGFLSELIDMGERAINSLLDASIAHLYPVHLCQGPRGELYKPWMDFMVPKATEQTGSADRKTYLEAMFLKSVICSRHAPLGLFRRTLFRGARVLDIGGGLGYYSALFNSFGAKATMCEKPESEPFVSDELKKRVKCIFAPFPIDRKDLTFNAIYLGEVLHCISKEEWTNWLQNSLADSLTKDGHIIITEVDITQQTLYSRLFDMRIQLKTEGKGRAIIAQDIIGAASSRFTVSALVTWHSLPYYTVILKKLR